MKPSDSAVRYRAVKFTRRGNVIIEKLTGTVGKTGVFLVRRDSGTTWCEPGTVFETPEAARDALVRQALKEARDAAKLHAFWQRRVGKIRKAAAAPIRVRAAK